MDDEATPARFTRDLVRWSETLAAIARTGLGFSENLYERERFEEVLNVAADIKAAANEALGVAAEATSRGPRDRPRAGPLRAGVAGVGRRRRARLRHAEGRHRRRRRQRRRPAAARAAGRLGHLAVPDGLGRRRLLAGRGRRQGGRRGDRHRVRADAGARRHRRPADGLLPLRHVHAAVPLPGHRRRAAAPPAGVRRRRLVRRRTTCPRRRPAPGGGRRWRSRAIDGEEFPTVFDAVRSPVWRAGAAQPSGSRSRRKRSTSATSSPSTASASRRPARRRVVVLLVVTRRARRRRATRAG